MTLFCDLDGVLADFDRGYHERVGVSRTGMDYDNVDWKAVKALGDFYEKLKPMRDMMELWNYIKPFKPTILTGVPYSIPDVCNQKKV